MLLMLLLIAVVHRLLLSAILRVHGNLGTIDLDRRIASLDRHHVLALRAAVFCVFEPMENAGKAGKADAYKAKDGANDTIIFELAHIIRKSSAGEEFATRHVLLSAVGLLTFALRIPPC